MSWSRRALLAAALGLPACGWLDAAPPQAAPPARFVDLQVGAGDLQSQLARYRAEAEREQRLAVLQVYADWCGPCKELRAALDDPRMVDAFAGTLIIRADHTVWEPQLTMMLPEGESISVPAFFVVDEEGGAGETISGKAWGPNTPE